MNRVNHQEIVKKLLDNKAVDFTAIGKVVAEAGPALSLADEPGDFFCGTMRYFFHIYILRPNPGDSVTETPSNLGAASQVLGS